VVLSFSDHTQSAQHKAQSEAASADVGATTMFPKKLAEIIEEDGQCSRQGSNMEGAGAFYEK
jgi:hypothetical protein